MTHDRIAEAEAAGHVLGIFLAGWLSARVAEGRKLDSREDVLHLAEQFRVRFPDHAGAIERNEPIPAVLARAVLEGMPRAERAEILARRRPQ